MYKLATYKQELRKSACTKKTIVFKFTTKFSLVYLIHNDCTGKCIKISKLIKNLNGNFTVIYGLKHIYLCTKLD